MLLIAGLGNPGSSYQFNRHNIGFMAVEAIARYYHFPKWKSKFQALVTQGTIADRKILLLKPQTYMNLSGQAVGKCLHFYKMDLEHLLVIHDDLDLFSGKARIKTGGGSGGHNGIKSIDAHIGIHYQRLRLGIGHPGNPTLVHAHVLGDFSQEEALWLERLMDALVQNIPLLIEGKSAHFMNKLDRAIKDKQQEN